MIIKQKITIENVDDVKTHIIISGSQLSSLVLQVKEIKLINYYVKDA